MVLQFSDCGTSHLLYCINTSYCLVDFGKHGVNEGPPVHDEKNENARQMQPCFSSFFQDENVK
jgi:hypothetical protein